MEQAGEKADERRSTPGVSKNWGEGEKWGGGEREEGGGGGSSLPSPSPSAPYFSHSLPISFPSRKFLETQARPVVRFYVGSFEHLLGNNWSRIVLTPLAYGYMRKSGLK